MARSFYKGERLGNRPPCLLCMGRGEGERAELHLPYGVAVWLCAAHRSAEFQVRRAGRDFVASLARAWAGAGCLTRARQRALDAHRARVLEGKTARERPGSYSWPSLRREAERRFAAGEPPRCVIRDLRSRERSGRAVPPSARTMRRWFGDRRWLGPDGGSGRGRPRRPSGGDAEGHDPPTAPSTTASSVRLAVGTATRPERGRPAIAAQAARIGPPWVTTRARSGSRRRQLAHRLGDPGAGVARRPRRPGARPSPRASRVGRGLLGHDLIDQAARPAPEARLAPARVGPRPRPAPAPPPSRARGAGRRSRRRPGSSPCDQRRQRSRLGPAGRAERRVGGALHPPLARSRSTRRGAGG